MTAWIDRNGRRYWMSEIDDRYLLNIINSLKSWTGDKHFVTDEKIEDLCEEAFKRGLMSAEEAHDKYDEILCVWHAFADIIDDACQNDDLWLYQNDGE